MLSQSAQLRLETQLDVVPVLFTDTTPEAVLACHGAGQ
jgi:hypothetical protein